MNKIIGGVAVLALALGGFAFFAPAEITPNLGASAGPEHTEHQYFMSGSTDGGRAATTSAVTMTAYTTVAQDFGSLPTYVDWLPNRAMTISLSATSTHQYVPKIGDVATIYFRNATTTAGAPGSITFAAVDSGLDLQDNEDSADLLLPAEGYMMFTFIRESAHLVTVLAQEYIKAD